MIEKISQNFKLNGDIIFGEKAYLLIDNLLNTNRKEMPFYCYYNEENNSYSLETYDLSYYGDYFNEYNGHTRFVEAYLLKDIIGIIVNNEKKELNCDLFISNTKNEQYIIRVSNNKVLMVKLPLDYYLFEEI